ncbi:MAG: sensor histidine kinase [Elusimicrobiota bacterium]
MEDSKVNVTEEKVVPPQQRVVNRGRRNGLGAKLASLFVLATTVFAVILAAVTITISRAALRKAVYDVQKVSVKLVNDRMISRLGRVKELVLLTARDQRLQNPKTKPLEVLRKTVTFTGENSVITGLVMYSSFGVEQAQVVNPRATQVDLNKLFENRVYLQPLKTGLSVVYEMFMPDTREWYVILSVPMKNRVGVIVAIVEMRYLSKLVEDLFSTEKRKVFFVTQQGKVFIHPNPKVVNSGLAVPYVTQLVQRVVGTGIKSTLYGTFVNEDNKKVLATVDNVAGIKWLLVSEVDADDVNRTTNDMILRVCVVTFIAIIVMLLIIRVFIKQITTPLVELQKGTEVLAKGNLEHRIVINTGDEINALADSFNQMAESLENSEKLRSDLNHMIVHDLKNPLTSILSGIEMLLDGTMGGELSEGQRKVLNISGRSSRVMLELVEDLLDVGKMDEGKLEIEKEEFVLADALRTVFDENELLAKQEEKAFYASVEENLPLVYGSRKLITRVVRNLLINAYKYTKVGDEIIFTARYVKENNEIWMGVHDTGEGIPAGWKDRIFDKFTQVKRKELKLAGGVGLGLTFCKMAVEAHGGRIWVESVEKKGSEFMFSIPLTKDNQKDIEVQK